MAGEKLGLKTLSKLQRRTWHILRGDLQPDMRCADVMELFGHDIVRKFGPVAFAAQMREVEMLQVGGHDLRGGLGGGGVGKMAVASEDALFQRP